MDTNPAEIFLQAADVLGAIKIDNNGNKGDVSRMGHFKEDGECAN
jgi:hypothetical protein